MKKCIKQNNEDQFLILIIKIESTIQLILNVQVLVIQIHNFINYISPKKS